MFDRTAIAIGKALAFIIVFMVALLIYVRYVVLGLLYSGSDLNAVGAAIASAVGVYGFLLLASWMFRDVCKSFGNTKDSNDDG